MRLRRDMASIQGYVPGRQPTGDGWIKLNTNESPEASPAALAAIQRAADSSIRLYPDPLCNRLREAAARRHNLNPEQIVFGNGSDDLLNLLIRAVCDPGDRVVAATPSYSLYPVLAAIAGTAVLEVPLGDAFALPVRQMAAARGKITFVASPNNPAGTHYRIDILRWLAAHVNVLVVDEAYVEFARGDNVALLRDFDNVCVTRSFSKSFGLAGLRLGYALTSPELADALLRMKDSYNVSRVAQSAGLAALNDFGWAESHWATIRDRRDNFATILSERFGLNVYPSEANFVFVELDGYDAADIQRQLEKRSILVRHFQDDQRITNALRISIGSAENMQALENALGEILEVQPRGSAAPRNGSSNSNIAQEPTDGGHRGGDGSWKD